jgi:hypothetical protein
VPRRTKYYPRPVCDPARRMRREIVAAKVRLGFYDHSRRPAVYQHFAEQIPRNFHGGPLVKPAFQNAPERHRRSTIFSDPPVQWNSLCDYSSASIFP